MKSKNTIQRLLAGFAFLLFLFSITPRSVLHSVFADHKDVQRNIYAKGSDKQQLQKAGFNCNCEDQVVQSPFTYEFSTVRSIPPLFFSEIIEHSFSVFHSIPHLHTRQRGPPSLV